MTQRDIRGYHILDDDGMPFVTIEALRRNLREEPAEIDVYIDLDAHEHERNPTIEDLLRIKPEVLEAVDGIRQRVGNLPLRVYKKCEGGRIEPLKNWLAQ